MLSKHPRVIVGAEAEAIYDSVYRDNLFELEKGTWRTV